MGGGTTNLTSISLAGTLQKKVQSTDDILKQIESTITVDSRGDKFKQEELSQRILGRISQHEAAFGDKNLPRQRLPKMDPMLLDRYNAARRNVLVLGAIRQATASKASTHRSVKSSTAPSVRAVMDHSDGASSVGDELLTERADLDLGLSSTFTSFAGSRHGSPDHMACDEEMTAEQSGLLGAEASQISVSSRRMRHQTSGRSAASSFAGSVAPSSTTTSRLRHITSSLSAGSGHTLRSEATYLSKYSHRKTPRKTKAAKPKPGRVTTALAEYATKDDWMSKTLLKHYLASVIQARWRGYIVRKRWAEQESRLALVEEENAKQQAAALHQQRMHESQQKLLARQAKRQAQAKAAAVAAAAAGDSQEAGSGSSSAERAAAAVNVAGTVSAMKILGMSQAGSRIASASLPMPYSRLASDMPGGKYKTLQSAKFTASDVGAGSADSDSDSGWSDIELEDVASIKFRAVTPPWQKIGEQYGMSQRLKQRTAASTAAATGQVMPEGWSLGEEFAAVGLAWDSSNEDCVTRLQELRRRRICRKPEPVQLTQAAVAAAAASGLLASAADAAAGGSEQDTTDASEAVIPIQVVEELLLDRYNTKYARMGVLDKMPGRQRWKKLQQNRQANLHSLAATVSVEAQPVLPPVVLAAQPEAVATAEPAASGTGAAATPTRAAPDRPYALKMPTGSAAAVSSTGAMPAALPPVKGAA